MNEDFSESSNLYRKARQLMDENETEQAIPFFQKSSEIDPHFKTLELLGECYIRLNSFREAVIPLAAAVTLNKGVRAASLLARVFLELRKYSAAEDMAETVLRRAPNNKIALEVKNVIANMNNDLQKPA